MKWERFRVAKASACDTEFMTLFGDDLTLRKVEAADSGGVGATEAQGQWGPRPVGRAVCCLWGCFL